MATYGGITPRQQEEYRQQTQRTDNTHTRTDNYNGFMTQRDHEPSGNPKSLSLEYGKTIKLLRNGDEFYKGQKVVINSRKYRYFDVFLDDLSDMMQARFGAVRNIHTPIHGHKVKSLDQIEDGKTYVASGAGRFVKLNYMDISEGKRARFPHRLPALNRQIDYSNIQVPQYDKPQNILIYVYRNGDILTPPAKILLPKNTLSSYDAVLNEITFKVQLLNGAVLKLYTMEGEPVITPAQLITGHGYVAANKEKFKRCEYYSPQEFNSTSPRNIRKINSQPVSHNSSNPSTSGKSTFSYPGKPYTGWHKEPTRREGSLPPVIGPRGNRGSQKSNNSRLDLDRDEGGVFKAKPKNSNTVKTIQDSKDMYIDMPVDYRKPKEIIDEEIDERRNRPPLPQNTVAKANSKQPPQQNNITQPKQPYEPKRLDDDDDDDNLRYNKSNRDDDIKKKTQNDHDDLAKKSKNTFRDDDDDDNNNLKTSRTNQNTNRKSMNQLDNDDDDENNNLKSSRTNPNTNRKSMNQIDDNDNRMSDHDAAIKIQSFYRGYKTREELKKKNPGAFSN